MAANEISYYRPELVNKRPGFAPEPMTTKKITARAHAKSNGTIWAKGLLKRLGEEGIK